MEINNIIVILACVTLITAIGLIFKISLWRIIKLIFNSILGGISIYFINQIGTSFGIHIGLNVVTSIFVGICGIPGVLLLLLIKIF